MAEILEAVMLMCFGFSWPISVIRNIRARTAKSMSLGFILLIIVGYIIIKCPEHKKYRLGQICLVGIIAGDIGNMIDRITQDYVVDFISFVLIHFPIFNVADIYVTVSMILILICILFIYKEEDLNFLSLKEKKLRQLDQK